MNTENEIKIGMIMQSLADAPKYCIFLSDSISVLVNEELLGKAKTFKEVREVINRELDKRGYQQDSYWRYSLDSNATFIDFGSWSKFIAVVPPISMQELTGED